MAQRLTDLSCVEFRLRFFNSVLALNRHSHSSWSRLHWPFHSATDKMSQWANSVNDPYSLKYISVYEMLIKHACRDFVYGV